MQTFNVINMIRTRLGKNPVAIQLPIGKEDSFVGLIDLFEMKAYYYNDDKGDDITISDIPEDMRDLAEEYRGIMIEAICDTDDDLMEKYLEGEEPSAQELKAALRAATISVKIIPVLCGSAYRNKGVQKLLDAVIEYLPAPTDVSDIKGIDENGNEVTRKSSDDEPFSALAFKSWRSFVGKLYLQGIFRNNECRLLCTEFTKNKRSVSEEYFKCTPTKEKIWRRCIPEILLRQ